MDQQHSEERIPHRPIRSSIFRRRYKGSNRLSPNREIKRHTATHHPHPPPPLCSPTMPDDQQSTRLLPPHSTAKRCHQTISNNQ